MLTALVLVAAVLVGPVGTPGPVGHDEHERVTVALPECEYEDSSDCMWQGGVFTAIDEGRVVRRFFPDGPTEVGPDNYEDEP